MFFSSLNKVFDFIEQNLQDDISINSLGNILGTNEDTFKRIFTLICGMSIAEYIKNADAIVLGAGAGLSDQTWKGRTF